MARLVITAVLAEGRTKSAVARDYGVSRRWVVTLCQRYAAEGEAALEPRSRRPRASPAQIGDEVEERIVTWRKQLTDEGLDAGAETIRFHLLAELGTAPAVSTIWRVLARRGFVVPQPHKRPRSSYIRFEADQPNERWQADITHWALADGTDVEILNVIDDHSRFAIGCHARSVFKAADVVTAFHDCAAAHGLPAGLLTDNGAVFTGNFRGRGWVALERELAALGVRQRHSRPYHPQTCGKVERFHQTLKRWLDRHPRATTIAELQAQLEEFRGIYNTKRPHRGIGRRTPISAYTARPKAGPAASPLTVDAQFRVRRDKVDSCGRVTLRHNSRLHHIGLGRRHAGTRIVVLVHELHIRVITEDGELLRELTLDPTRDYQSHSQM